MWDDQKCLSWLFPLHLNTYVMGIWSLYVFNYFTDVWQKSLPPAERVITCVIVYYYLFILIGFKKRSALNSVPLYFKSLPRISTLVESANKLKHQEQSPSLHTTTQNIRFWMTKKKYMSRQQGSDTRNYSYTLHMSRSWRQTPIFRICRIYNPALFMVRLPLL